MLDVTINDAMTMAGGGGALLAGRYRVVRQLGQGGMGSVWLAEDTQLDGKLFAIKMLPSILVSNKRAYRQLKDEALVAMQLVHPNIVQIRAFEENNGNPFLVMDYIEGQTLDDYLVEHAGDVLTQRRRDAEGGDGRAASTMPSSGGLPEEDVIRLLKPIAAALDYAHTKGVVHRDVKPGNVMVAKDGTPYILDFGIAREIQETMTRVTGKLSSGTLLYMSPEQLNGDPPRPAQDVYSFAAMVYECMKGEPPFSRGNIEFQIMNKEPEPLVGRDVPIAPLADGVMAGLAKKPVDRPSTCVGVLSGSVLTQSSRDAKGQRADSNHVEHVEGVARTTAALSMDAGAPGRKERKERKGVGRAIAVLALLAAIGVGVWWWQERQSDIPVLPVKLVPPVVTTNEKPIVIDKPVRQLDDESRAAAMAIRIEALVRKGMLEQIADGDGFKARKDELANVFARADALFDVKICRWSEAAQMFTNYVNKCDALVELDKERSNACECRKTASESSRVAVANEGADKYAADTWQLGVDTLKAGDRLFGENDFSQAAKSFGEAAKLFAKSEKEAKSAKVQLDKATKEEKAKKQRKALDELAKNPLCFNDFADALPEHQQAVLSPLYDKLREADYDVKKLLIDYTEEHPEVIAAQAKKSRLLLGFRNQVDLLRTGTGARDVSPATDIDGVKNGTPRHGDVKTLALPGGAKMEMIYVAPGSFMMGSPASEEGRKNNEAQHRVTLTKGYWLGKYEVTQKQWQSVMGEIPSYAELPLDYKGDQYPVIKVSWDDCQMFVRRVNLELNCGARLPTEAEWEYACRAGSTTAYHWGGVLNGEKANCNGNFPYGTAIKGPYLQKPTPVGHYAANQWGFYDMHGNVNEWCDDWYDKNYYAYSPANDPHGPASGQYRVSRGGSMNFNANNCRSAFRIMNPPELRAGGFRLCCDRMPNE